MSFKLITITGAALMAALSLSETASAQIYDGAGFSQSDDFALRATVGITVPLGAMNSKKIKEQSRLGFGVTLDRNISNSFTGQRDTRQMNLIDIGLYESKAPSLQLYGQEFYGPTLAVIYADETGEKSEADAAKSSKDSTLLLIVGGVAIVTLGTVVLAAEAADDFSDCFLVFTDVPDKCRD